MITKLFLSIMLIILSTLITINSTAQSSNTSSSYKAGQTFRDCPDCPEMVVIPAGSFMMGSPETETGPILDTPQTPLEGPQKRITIKQFACGKFDITKKQWAEFVKQTNRKTTGGCMFAMLPTSDSTQPWLPDTAANWNHVGFAQDSTHPAICLSWTDANDYVQWLSKKTGLTYRLLTEAEWEYADRAGTTTSYYWGNTASREYANYGDDSVAGKGFAAGRDKWLYTSPVGSFPPNRFGLYDMNGNAIQWVEDCLSITYSNLNSDGTAFKNDIPLKFAQGYFSVVNGKGACGFHAARGGGYGDTPKFIRSAARNFAPLPGTMTPDLSRSSGSGFRVARAFKNNTLE